MKDFVFLAALPFIIYFILKRPFIGVGMWMWTAMFFPNGWMWGIGSYIRYNLLFTGLTVLSCFFSREPQKLVLGGTGKLVLFILFSSLVSAYLTVGIQEVAIEYWIRFAKVVTLFLFILYVVNNKVHIDFFLWCLVLSIGFFGFIEGMKYIASGGGHKIEGMSGHVLGDRNELAIAMVMLLPICAYLNTEFGKRSPYIKLILMSVIFFNVFAILGTHSRGGLISLIFLSGIFFIKSKRKIVYLVLLLVASVVASFYIPDEWITRMNTIGNADEDSSFMGRVVAWKLSLILALDNPIFGGGMKSLETWPVWQYLSIRFNDPSMAWFSTAAAVPSVGRSHAAHSIYFQVLGELGFLGLSIFLLIAFTSLRRAKRLIENENTPEWVVSLAEMLRLSMYCYFLGGAALSFAYFDLIYAIYALLIVLEYKVLPSYRVVK